VRPWGVPAERQLPNTIENDLDLPTDWRANGALLDPSGFAVAVVYRSLTPMLEPSDIRALVQRLRNFPSNSSAAAKVESLRSSLTEARTLPPHRQGYELAIQVREQLHNRDGKVDIENEMNRLGIAIEGEDLSDPDVDAATIWDDAHGPVVIVNKRSRRRQAWARRMTIAHELCHLLVDRSKAAPLMIASTPWAPAEIERRANAFAAELLLPKAGIVKEGGALLAKGDIDAARERLMTAFGVGETVCRHQLQNRLDIED